MPAIRTTAIAIAAVSAAAALFSSHADARCLAANQWAWGNCGSSTQGGGSRSSSGGSGPNYGAAIGSIGAALGALSDIAAEEEARQQAQRDRADAERRAYCHGNWRQASADVESGNRIFNEWNPGGAIPYYERAISLLGRCGDSKNIAVVRRNLDQARKQYAAIKDDNRVSDALGRYGGNNFYDKGGNPFARAPADGAAKPPSADPRLSAEAIGKEAAKRCDYAPSGSASWKTCMATQEARLIMDADPDIKSMCGIETNAAKRNACAIKAYGDRLAAKNANPSGKENCYWDQNGKPCYPGGKAAAATTEKPKAATSLRDELRRRLQAKDAAGGTGPDEGAPDPASDGKPSGQLPEQAVVKNEPAPSSAASNDDPLQSYMNARKNDGIRNSGEFDQTNFSMSGSQTRREIDRLTTVRPGDGEIYGPPSPDK